jgi:lipopolysaccharide/colanic/teichoic acid biosynthesis glycosyltransferase
MLIELRKYMTSRQKRTHFPWLLLFDMIGLGIVLGLVAVQIKGQIGNHEGQVFILLLGVFALNSYLLLDQFKTLETGLGKNRILLLFTPMVAGALTLVFQALSRSYYSGRALGIFVVFWALWLLLGRFIHRRYRTPVNILLVEPCSFADELKRVQGVQVTVLREPPKNIRNLNFNVVAIDPSSTYSNEWLHWLAHADMHGVRTISAPLVIEALTRRVPINMLQGQWAYEMLNRQSIYLFWKRLFDILAVVILSPVLLVVVAIVALIVLLDSGAPVLFRQRRVGVDGRPFTMVKFRTMKTNSEENGAAFASLQDPRVTKIGQFLRKFRLDEIPQFWNVLKGDMSIIGPRPEQISFAKRFDKEIPLYSLRHNVRPGITGWAQVMQGYAAGTDETREKLCYDVYYVKNCSAGLDLRIIYHTIQTVLTGFGSR